jgi:DnaJ-class molecular chaperone
MAFGQRKSANDIRSVPTVQETCTRCCGTGFVRERGSKIVCKPCKGSGRVVAEMQRAS